MSLSLSVYLLASDHELVSNAGTLSSNELQEMNEKISIMEFFFYFLSFFKAITPQKHFDWLLMIRPGGGFLPHTKL